MKAYTKEHFSPIGKIIPERNVEMVKGINIGVKVPNMGINLNECPPSKIINVFKWIFICVYKFQINGNKIISGRSNISGRSK